MTRAQRQKARLRPIGDRGKEPERRKTNNEEDWKEEERLQNPMIEAISAIQKNLLEEQQAANKARGSSSTKNDVGIKGELLDNDWTGFLEYDLVSDTTKSSQRKEDQSNKSQSNEDEVEQVTKMVGKQILDRPIILSSGQLLRMAPKLLDSVIAHLSR